MHLNHDRRTRVHVLNRALAFNQLKRSERFRKILSFISLRVFSLVNAEQSGSGSVLKEMVHALVVRLPSYGWAWEVG